jgi:hypothetical protein
VLLDSWQRHACHARLAPGTAALPAAEAGVDVSPDDDESEVDRTSEHSSKETQRPAHESGPCTNVPTITGPLVGAGAMQLLFLGVCNAHRARLMQAILPLGAPCALPVAG